MEDKIKRARWVFEGRCQGVGFRWVTQREARRLNVVGWVQNQFSGDVIMEVEGKESALLDLYSAIYRSYANMPFTFSLKENTELEVLGTETNFDVLF